jgi:hypothetical protein
MPESTRRALLDSARHYDREAERATTARGAQVFQARAAECRRAATADQR